MVKAKQFFIRFSTILILVSIILGTFFHSSLIVVKAIDQNGVESRINSLKSVFPTGSYFSANGGPCDSSCLRDGLSYACDNCHLKNIIKQNATAKNALSSTSGLGVSRYSCCAFAAYAFYYIFGHDHTSNSYTIHSNNYGGVTDAFLSQLRKGDFLRLNDGNHFGIFLGYDQSHIYLYHANTTAPCQVQYNGARSRSNYSEIKAYRSKSYDVPETITPTVTHGYSGSVDKITESNAVVYATVTKPASATTERFGIRIRRTTNTYENGWSYYHAPSSSYSGQTSIKIWFDIQKEVGITLTHATSYAYQLYAKIDGKEYWSEEKTITTAGSHSFGQWTTTKEATCTNAGSKQRKCACGAAETESINPLGHSYSTSWTIDTQATCTTAGSKSHHCTACSAKKDVTSIAATGHSFGQWTTVKEATCTAAGNSQRKCACGATEYKSINALGHSWGPWAVTKEATVEEAGEEKRACSRCDMEDSKTIPQLATDGHKHNYEENEWMELTPATCTQDGSKIRYCGLCPAAEIQTIPALSHDLSDWQTVLEPTEEGLAVQNCVRCTYQEEMSLPKLNVPDTTLPAYEPTNDTPTSPTPTEAPSQPSTTPTQDGTDLSKTLIVLTAVSLLLGLGSICALIVIVVNRKKR